MAWAPVTIASSAASAVAFAASSGSNQENDAGRPVRGLTIARVAAAVWRRRVGGYSALSRSVNSWALRARSCSTADARDFRPDGTGTSLT